MELNWNDLEKACGSCQKCALAANRNNVVFGTGNRNAKVLFVGEGPGQQEDEQGLPFVGRSGKLLDSNLEKIGLSRSKNIYIANIVKCRPPNNRDPLPEERDACINWLRGQFKLMRPKIIVCVGRVAAQVMIKPDFAIMKEHGLWFEKGETLFMATLHPAALLRNVNNMPLADSDFQNLKSKIIELCPETYDV